MAVSLSYPGVYIEEVPSAVRTITGVATSITAFVGRALRGPIDEPRRITNFGDFERIYGGLWLKSSMSYAVQQYFLNGGVDAVIARVAHTPVGAEAACTAATLEEGTGLEVWRFEAVNSGAEGNAISITITNAASDTENRHLFDIVITDGTVTETLTDVEVDDLDDGDLLGTLVRVRGPIPPLRPDPVAAQPLENGADAGFATATIGGIGFTAATIGGGGNALRATVSDATDTLPVHYNVRIELRDPDGDLLASTLYENVDPTLTWPTPTRTNTTDALIDTTDPTAPPRPANGTAPFTLGSDVERASTEVGITVEGLPLQAANPGSWGNDLQAMFDRDTIDKDDATPTLFNLTVREVARETVRSGGTSTTQVRELGRETFRNVSVNPDHKRFIKKVLEEESVLARLPGSGPWPRPEATPVNMLGIPDWQDFSGGNDGGDLTTADLQGSFGGKTGIYLLEKADLFNLLVIPPPTRGGDTDPAVWIAAMKYCKDRRALLIVDAPVAWTTKDNVVSNLDALGLQGPNATNAAMYWPQIRLPDPLREFRLEAFPPGGAIAGLMARTDAQLGVWKAPAGVDASVTGARALAASVTDLEHGQINPLGVNVLRTFPVIGNVAWGARTIRGADVLADEWKYVPVRRLALMIEESLYRGTKWAVFAPNGEALWAQLRLNIGAFMQNLFRQGAFQGSSPRDAYQVKCDSETTTQSDIDRGIVNVLVGFRPLKPAEFVVLKISQLAGQVGA